MTAPTSTTGCFVCGRAVGLDCDCSMESRFDLEMEDCLVVHVYDTAQFERMKAFTRMEITRAEKKQRMAIFQLIAKEMSIANQQGHPTSRLTSLANKISMMGGDSHD